MAELLKMHEKGITSLADLRTRIRHLSAQKEEQEAEIKQDIRELYFSIHPSSLLTNIMKGSVSRNEWTPGLRGLVFSLGRDFLLARIFRSHRSVKGFLAAALFSKAATHLIHDADVMKAGLDKIKKILKRVRRKL